MRLTNRLIACLAVAALASSASAQVRITEWQYNGTEFVELTNLGAAPVSLSGWSFDDDGRTPGAFPLSGLGTLAPNQTAVMAELAEAAFRGRFPAMPASVAVVGGNTNNLGRADEINIYDAANVLVDRLNYNDQAAAPNTTIRTDVSSGNPATLAEALLGGADNTVATNWVLSTSGDRFGSFASTTGGFANPGVFALVPEPTTLAATFGLATLGLARRRRG